MSVSILSGLQLDWPVDWSVLFERPAPLLLEIGFGRGDFLVELAQKQPLANVVGLEISLPSLRKGARKVSRRGLTNVAIVQADANYALHALFRPASLSEVYINFPDPWPKPGHEHRRLINPYFLRLLASRMPAEARLNIATDHPDYAAAIVTCLETTPYFVSRRGQTAVVAHGLLGTKYEQKGLAEGRPGYYFYFERNQTPLAFPFPVLKESAMPHVVLESPLTLAEIADQFRPDSVTVGETAVSLIELFHSAQQNKLLIEAYVKEAALSQHIAAAIRCRQNGQLVVELHDIGFPRPTVGTHHLIRFIVDWLSSLHADTTVVNSTLAGDK